jgi:hypothetical protein
MTRPGRFIAAALAALAPAVADAQVLTFEGISDFSGANTAPIGNFYNGGGGPNYGIEFGPTAVVLCFNTSTRSCSNTSRGDRGNPASQGAGLDFLVGGSAVMNRVAGFTTGFSFFYAAINTPGSFTVYEGLDGTGAVLATLGLGLTPSGPEPCYGAGYCPFVAAGVSFAGTAHSVVFAGANDRIIFDDVTFGSATPGVVTPEPGTYALLATGLVGVAGLARRRRSRA